MRGRRAGGGGGCARAPVRRDPARAQRATAPLQPAGGHVGPVRLCNLGFQGIARSMQTLLPEARGRLAMEFGLRCPLKSGPGHGPECVCMRRRCWAWRSAWGSGCCGSWTSSLSRAQRQPCSSESVCCKVS